MYGRGGFFGNGINWFVGQAPDVGGALMAGEQIKSARNQNALFDMQVQATEKQNQLMQLIGNGQFEEAFKLDSMGAQNIIAGLQKQQTELAQGQANLRNTQLGNTVQEGAIRRAAADVLLPYFDKMPDASNPKAVRQWALDAAQMVADNPAIAAAGMNLSREGIDAATDEQLISAVNQLRGSVSMYATPKGRTLSPDEARAAGYQPGSMVYTDANGKPSVVQSPAAADGGLPADVQTALWYAGASPELQGAFDHTKRAFDPEGAFADGEYDPAEFANRKESGKVKGKLTTEAIGSLRASIPPMRNALSGLYRMLDIVEQGPETGPVSQWNRALSSEMQALDALLKDQLFDKVSSARAAGATFGSMTEAEWELLAKTVGSLSTTRAANKKIISAQIAKIERQLKESNRQISRASEGEWLDLPQGPVEAYPTAPESAESITDDAINAELRRRGLIP